MKSTWKETYFQKNFLTGSHCNFWLIKFAQDNRNLELKKNRKKLEVAAIYLFFVES